MKAGAMFEKCETFDGSGSDAALTKEMMIDRWRGLCRAVLTGETAQLMTNTRELWNQMDDATKAGLKLQVQFHETRPIGIELPKSMKVKIQETQPMVKGATQSSSYKPATLENGIVIQVPPFVTDGEEIIVDPSDNPALQSLRWKKFPVLDDGFVALADCMGTDAAVVQAVTVSRTFEGAAIVTKGLSAGDTWYATTVGIAMLVGAIGLLTSLVIFGGHRTGGITGGGNSDLLDPKLLRHRDRGCHPASLETLCWILALVFNVEIEPNG